jgi:dihydroflavonol-4-reductase
VFPYAILGTDSLCWQVAAPFPCARVNLLKPMEPCMNLITGATGHIGNVLVRQLLKHGERVRVLVRPGNSLTALEGLDVERYPGDVLDPASLLRAMQGVAVIYHLAARISIEMQPDPEIERVNLEGTRNVIAAARSAGVRRLVYASSIYALRIPATGLIDESLPFDPQYARGAYDCSKAAASLEVQQAAAAGLDAVIICPTAVAGPYDFHDSESGRGIRLNMSPGLKFTVDGAYDFVDVRDVALGFILAAERGVRGETYILGGERLTVKQVAKTVWDAAGNHCVSINIPLWLAYFVADSMPIYTTITGTKSFFTRYSLDAVTSNSNISHSKAEKVLGYHPRPARRAITDAVKWLQTQDHPGQEETETLIEAAV